MRPGEHLVQEIIPKLYEKNKFVTDTGPVESSFAARSAASCCSPLLQALQYRVL